MYFQAGVHCVVADLSCEDRYLLPFEAGVVWRCTVHPYAPSDESGSRSGSSRSAHETLNFRGSTLHIVRLSCVPRVTNLYPQVKFLRESWVHLWSARRAGSSTAPPRSRQDDWARPLEMFQVDVAFSRVASASSWKWNDILSGIVPGQLNIKNTKYQKKQKRQNPKN